MADGSTTILKSFSSIGADTQIVSLGGMERKWKGMGIWNVKSEEISEYSYSPPALDRIVDAYPKQVLPFYVNHGDALKLLVRYAHRVLSAFEDDGSRNSDPSFVS